MNRYLEPRIKKVREAVDDARNGLTAKDDRELLEELLADAEGWRMELMEEELMEEEGL